MSIKQRLEGRLIDLAEMVNDEVRLNELLSAQCEDFQVTEVQVSTPGWINRGPSWRMELLRGISLGYDKNEVVVCLLEVESGQVYTDSHDRSSDVNTLTNLRKIY
ncbi:hypothetical protein C1884_16630 [Pseudomonas sp. GW460-R15]|nr:hypothetical protein C1887_05265 [Pseudomonas sp. GW456-R21]POA65918.1 hypothetical protein C1884_16630 [Pseudomonas sp. GW460-R15]